MKKRLSIAVLLAAFVGTANAQYLLNESFDNDQFTTSGGVTTDLPDGWTRQDQYSGTNNDYRWGVYYTSQSSNSITGSYALKCDAPMFSDEEDGKGPRVERVLTPELDLQDSYLLTFQWAAAAKSSLEDKEYELQVRVLDLTTNTETTIFNTSNVEDVRNSGVLADPNDASRIWPNWTKNVSTLDLSAYKGKKIKIVFAYNMKKEKANVVYVDEVKVKKGEAATTPVAKVDQTSYDFGKLYIGEKVYSETLKLKNTGVSGLTYTGCEAPEGFGVNISKSINLSKNEEASFQLYYKAALTTKAEGDVVLKTNGGDVTIHVTAQKEVVPDGYTLELFEDFPPAGWNANSGWTGSGYALEGDKSAYTSASLEDADLVSPRLDLSDATKPHKVMFTYYNDFTSEEGGSYPTNDLELFVSTDGGATWPTTAEWTADYMKTSEIIRDTIDLSKYTSDNVKLKWRNTAVQYDSDSGEVGEFSSIYMDRVMLPNVYGADGKPLAAELVTPANEATDVYPKSVVLKWNKAQFAEGYKVYVGKTSTSFDVADGADVNDATSYTLLALDYQTTYYWKVVAYNTEGDGDASSVYSFTTQKDMTVSTFPWFEGFENSVPPLGWYRESTGNGSWSSNTYEPYDGKVSLSASARTVNEVMTITTPDVKLPADKDMQISFWWGNAMCVILKKDTEKVHTNTTTGSNGADAGFFEIYSDGEWKQLTMLSDPADDDNRYWLRECFDLKPYAGKTVQFRWRYEMYDYNKCKGVSLDNIELADANVTNVTLSTSSWFTGKVNYNQSKTSEAFTLSNFGGKDISVTGVKFTSDNFTSTLAVGDNIAAGKTQNFTITFNAKTTAAQDSVTVNDKMEISLSDGSTLAIPVVGVALAKDILYFDFEQDVTGNLPAQFTGIDEDGLSIYKYWSWTSPALGNTRSFFVINDSECNSVLKGLTGHQSLMSAIGVNSQDQGIAKDWIVSQKLDINSNSTFAFDARNWESVTSVLPSNAPTLTVWVSETSPSEISAFTQVGKSIAMELYDNVAWSHYTFDLSAYAGKSVYVALRSETNDGEGSFYDNFEYAHVGYNASGINSVTANKLADEYVTVYSISGMKLAEGKNTLNKVANGIYIVKTATQTMKVVKR